jgi:hypothetical protein
MKILCNLYAIVMLWGRPGGIFPDQGSCGQSGAASTRLVSDGLPHEEASGAVTGPAERRWCPCGEIALDTLAGEADP